MNILCAFQTQGERHRSQQRRLIGQISDSKSIAETSKLQSHRGDKSDALPLTSKILLDKTKSQRVTIKKTYVSISIGVLAGMGPRSTAPFIDMLVTACQTKYGAKYDLDFPEIHIISLPTPFWPGQEINHKEMISALRHGISKLVRAEVSLISVPCNLAHCYFSEMQNACQGIPLLHIADSAIKRLPLSSNKIAVLATDPTHAAGFYQQRLSALGKQPIQCPQIRSITTKLISQIKEKGFNDSTVQSLWDELVTLAVDKNADAMMIACTDISPLALVKPPDITTIDTETCLAEATIDEYLNIASATK